MTRVLVNNQPQEAPAGAETWADLLAALDGACRERGEVVTAVRLDGVDEPSFRSPEQGVRALGELAVIECEAESPAALLAESLREASRGLDELRQHALSVGRRFRGRDIEAAQRGLLELVQGLQVLTSLVATIGAVLGTDVATLTVGDTTAGRVLDGLGSHLETLIGAQQNQDWLTVADIVEFDIEPALGGCRPVFDSLTSLVAQTH